MKILNTILCIKDFLYYTIAEVIYEDTLNNIHYVIETQYIFDIGNREISFLKETIEYAFSHFS